MEVQIIPTFLGDSLCSLLIIINTLYMDRKLHGLTEIQYLI